MIGHEILPAVTFALSLASGYICAIRLIETPTSAELTIVSLLIFNTSAKTSIQEQDDFKMGLSIPNLIYFKKIPKFCGFDFVRFLGSSQHPWLRNNPPASPVVSVRPHDLIIFP